MAIELEDGEVIREAEHVAALIEGNATTNFVGATKVISARLPLHLLADLEAFAEKSGRSRNAMLAMLLDVGLEEVRAGLKPKTVKEIQTSSDNKMSAMAPEAH